MRRRSRPSPCWLCVASAPAAALDASSYRWERSLAAERGLAAFEPDGPMYEHAAVGSAT